MTCRVSRFVGWFVVVVVFVFVVVVVVEVAFVVLSGWSALTNGQLDPSNHAVCVAPHDFFR